MPEKQTERGQGGPLLFLPHLPLTSLGRNHGSPPLVRQSQRPNSCGPQPQPWNLRAPLSTQEQTCPGVVVACGHTLCLVGSTVWETECVKQVQSQKSLGEAGGGTEEGGCGCLPRSHSDGTSMLCACTPGQLIPGLTITLSLVCFPS